MGISVKKEIYVKAPNKNTCERRSQAYVNGSGLKRVERKNMQSESDWADASYERYSEDNGKTWGKWQDIHAKSHIKKGNDEINTYYGTETYNPKYGHFVSVGMQRIFFGGHSSAYKARGKGEIGFVDHSLCIVRKDGSEERTVDFVKYEQGADYDPENWTNPEYTFKNRAYKGNAVEVLENGEIIFPIIPNIRSCCRILDIDVNEIFPSCPHLMGGLIVVRGKYNEKAGKYDLTFSKPAVISDLLSSRGVLEPEAVMLPSGRILAVFRGSNVQTKGWNTRIEPGTPSHKWYCYSDDGGKTFTDPAPWHFDNREVFYSSSSIHRFIRSKKNGKIYWLGNISDYSAYGNHPRHPLIIAEVNDCGLLIKDTLTTVDDRQKRESDKLQLSNFSVLQDRETGNIEIYLVKLGQREGYTWWADCWRYTVDVDS